MNRGIGAAVICGLVASALACRTDQSVLRRYAREGRCEQAAELAGSVKLRTVFSQSAKATGGSVASYSLVGLSGAADIVLLYTPGTILAGLICSPGLLVDIPLSNATHGNSNGNSLWGDCTSEIVSEFSKDIGFPMGGAAHGATAAWRGRNFDPISNSMRLVAECHLASDDENGGLMAKKQVQIIKEKYFDGLSLEERVRVDELLIRLEEHQRNVP